MAATIDLSGGGARTRKITRSLMVSTSAGALATLPIGRLASPVTCAKSSGSSDLTVASSTGVISSTAGIGNTVSEQIIGTMTGADGCVIPFDYTLTGVTAVTVPAAPTLALTPGNNQVSLAWTDGSTGGAAITGHKLYRGTTSGAETLIGTIATGSPYVDSGLTNSTVYYYKLSAVNSVGEGALSTEQSATPTAGGGSTFNDLTLPYDGKQVFETTPATTKIGTIRDKTAGSTLSIIAVYDWLGNSVSTSLFALSGGDLVCGSTATSFATSPWHTVRVRESKAGFTDLDSDLKVTVCALQKPGTPFTENFTGTNGDPIVGTTPRTGWTGGPDSTGDSSFQNTIQINNNMLSFVDAGTTNVYIASFDAVTPNIDVKFNAYGAMTTVSSASKCPGIYLRYQTRTTNNILIQVLSSINIQITRRINGSTSGGSFNYNPNTDSLGNLASGDEVRVTVINGLLRLYVKNALTSFSLDVSGVTTSNRIALSTALGGATGTAGTNGIDNLVFTPLPSFGIDTMRQPVFVIDLADGKACIPLSGGLPTSGAPTSLEYRIENTSSGTALTGYDWQALPATFTSATGVPCFYAFVKEPLSPGNTIKVRDAAATTNVVPSSSHSAGYGILLYGQSNNEHNNRQNASATDSTGGKSWFGDRTLTPLKTGVGYSAAGLMNTIWTATGQAVLLLNVAKAATSVTDLMPGNGVYISPDNTNNTDYFENLQRRVMQFGGQMNFLGIAQGEKEGAGNPTNINDGTWATIWQGTANKARLTCGMRKSEFPVRMSFTKGQGVHTNIQEAQGPGYLQLRIAQAYWATLEPNFGISHHAFDTDYTNDGGTDIGIIHYTDAHQLTKHGPRWANKFLRDIGYTSTVPDPLGPYFSSITRPDSTHTVLQVSPNGATGLSVDAGTLGGYQLIQGTAFTSSTSPAALISFTISVNTATNQVTLTHSAITGPICFRYPVSTIVNNTGTIMDGAEMFGGAYGNTTQPADPQVRGTYADGSTIGMAPCFGLVG